MGRDPTDRQGRATSFGSAAEAYERFRPGYADLVADRVLAGLDPRPRRVLESGAGTGKATRLFVSRGVDLTVVEPHPAMRDVLERVVPRPEPPGRLTLVESTLERLPQQLREQPYDLLYAAASWHWTDEETRWQRAAALLRPGGVFASFGGSIEPVDVELGAAIEELRPDVPHAGPRTVVETMDGQCFSWPGDDLMASPYFTKVEQIPLPVEQDWPAADYLGLLSTISAFLILPSGERASRLTRVRALLPDPIRVRHDVGLHRAVRTDVPAAWPG